MACFCSEQGFLFVCLKNSFSLPLLGGAWEDILIVFLMMLNTHTDRSGGLPFAQDKAGSLRPGLASCVSAASYLWPLCAPPMLWGRLATPWLATWRIC